MKSNIQYFHIKNLGTPKNYREELKQKKDYLKFFKKYKEHLEKNTDHIIQVKNILLSNGKSALLCYEKEHYYCHRSIVAAELKRWLPKLRVIPL